MNNRLLNDCKSGASQLKWIAWIGALPILIVLYLLIGPWIVLLIYGFIPNVSSDDPLGNVTESFIYLALKLAEGNEFYGEYFWYALRGLGG